MDSVRTGDTLLFSNNSPTGFLLRIATRSSWSHVGVAVRVLKHENEDGLRISLDTQGELCILEISTYSRYDIFTDRETVGAALTPFDLIKSQHNIIGVRRLKEKYRTQEFAEQILPFLRRYSSCQFTSYPLEFVQVWTGLPFLGKYRNDELFCTELVVKFYDECANIPLLYGDDSYEASYMYRPCDFVKEFSDTPFAPLQREDLYLYQDEGDPGMIFLPPLVLGTAIFLIIVLLLFILSGIEKYRRTKQWKDIITLV